MFIMVIACNVLRATKLTCNFFSNMWTMWSLGNYCASRDQFRHKSFHSYEHLLHHLIVDEFSWDPRMYTRVHDKPKEKKQIVIEKIKN